MTAHAERKRRRSIFAAVMVSGHRIVVFDLYRRHGRTFRPTQRGLFRAPTRYAPRCAVDILHAVADIRVTSRSTTGV
ncbi:hypothetical protein KCP73_23815 [Salmonella enterica subsp. enterica]|nr:hypothetical protein KCP73_23815 [Salmonella enterica subsp. enterica]